MFHIFLSFIFFNIIVYDLYGHYKRGGYYVKTKDLYRFVILFILFGTYGGGEGDFLHYKDIVEGYNTMSDVLFYTGMEQHYVYLSYLVGGNYYLWRFVLFSFEFLGFGFFLYKSKLNTYPILLSFATLCLITSVYGRAAWGGIYFFFGVYLLIEKKNPLYLIAIILSYVSHTSGLVRIFLLPLAFINIKRWHIIAIVLIFGSLVVAFREKFTDIINSGGIDYEGAEYINDRLQTYGEGGSKSYFGKSLGTAITIILKDILVVSILYSITKSIFKNRNGYLSMYKPLRGVINISLGIVLLSFIVLAASVGSAPFFYRIFDMSTFMVSIILPCLTQSNFFTKRRYENYIYWFIFYSEFGYLRDLYYAYANGVSFF